VSHLGLRSAWRGASALLLLGCLSSACGARPQLRPLDAPYVPTPEATAVDMLRLAGVTASDTVYDLGSGDGRVVIAAARLFGARGVGVELDASLVQQSRENAVRAGVADRVSFVWQDVFVADIRPATVVTLYLFQEVNLKLRPKLLRELRPGTRVVSHDYDMGEWRADQVFRVRSPEREHVLYLWVVPADVAGAWRMQAEGASAEAFTLTLKQRFQDLTGTLTADGRDMPLTGATLRGDELTFVVRREAPGEALRMRFSGRVAGETIALRGYRETGGSESAIHWKAVRIR
jgi:SAM-dependent methyltransferase